MLEACSRQLNFVRDNEIECLLGVPQPLETHSIHNNLANIARMTSRFTVGESKWNQVRVTIGALVLTTLSPSVSTSKKLVVSKM